MAPHSKSGSGERVVLSMKWGKLYPASYVNVLYNACRRNITGDFRFVCLTDDATGLGPDIEAYPIPDLGLTQGMWKSGAWAKLGVFEHDLYGLKGRALFIDLDMVICGALDPFFDHPAPVLTTDMGEGWGRPSRANAPREAGTCIFAFTLGAEGQIVDRFTADREKAVRDHVIEQNWVGAEASAMEYWPDGWVISFKRHLRRPVGLDLILPPKAPPASAKVLAFHGTPRPIDLLRPGNRFWDRFPHMGHGQVRWMADYWVENGGDLPR
ncbi:hypothetical protein [Gemmobacter sp. 24YEA27]|uniref:hypothetical protein n=1 Tax=Gemmobacter sp. 24YEA27 TaxID=3040672 RepID=UPI0024B35172|nr:hypothetical protein [Gemmobacter sp. 24YEA27]